MKTAIVIDNIDDLRKEAPAVDSAGQLVQVGDHYNGREILFSEIEKDPGKGHFKRDEAELIARLLGKQGFQIEASPFPGFFCVVGEDGKSK
jgi:hypothetical protein